MDSGTSSQEVMVDIDSVGLCIAGLVEQGDLFSILQFATLAESAVLHERLRVVTIEDDDPPTEDEEAWRTVARQFLGEWEAAGVVAFETWRREPSGREHAAVIDPVGEGPNDQGVHVVNAEDDIVATTALQAARTATVERSRQTPATSLPLQRLFYERSANVLGDNAICDLTAQYQELAHALAGLRASMVVRRNPYVSVALPPIAFSIIRRSRAIENLQVAVLDVRENYARLRDDLKKLERLMDDPEVPLRRKLRERDRWVDVWHGLHGKYSDGSRISMAFTNRGIYEHSRDVPGLVALDPTKWILLLSKVLERAPEQWYRWKVRALHRTARGYLGASDRDLTRAIEAMTGQPVTTRDVQEVTELDDLMTQFAESGFVLIPLDQPADIPREP